MQWVCLEPVTTRWYVNIIKWRHHCTNVYVYDMILGIKGGLSGTKTKIFRSTVTPLQVRHQSAYKIYATINQIILTSNCAVPTLSNSNDCTLDICTPISLCTPEHSIHVRIPKLVESHWGSEIKKKKKTKTETVNMKSVKQFWKLSHHVFNCTTQLNIYKF